MRAPPHCEASSTASDSRTRLRRTQAGAALAELALILPLLLLIMVGMIDLGRLFYAGIEVASAARAGVQYGTRDPMRSNDLAGMQSAAVNDAVNLSNLTATPTRRVCHIVNGLPESCVEPCPSTGDPTDLTCGVSGPVSVFVVVRTQAVINTLIPWPGLPSSVTLKGEATMRSQ